MSSIKLNYVYENDYGTRVLPTEYEENANYFVGVNLETERKHMYAVRDFKEVEIDKPIKEKILDWAKPKDLLKYENRFVQLAKLSEEVGELANAIIKNDKANQKDAIGDIYVVLTILANQLHLDIDECIESAYNEIKDRKGTTSKDGSFIKE